MDADRKIADMFFQRLVRMYEDEGHTRHENEYSLELKASWEDYVSEIGAKMVDYPPLYTLGLVCWSYGRKTYVRDPFSNNIGGRNFDLTRAIEIGPELLMRMLVLGELP